MADIILSSVCVNHYRWRRYQPYSGWTCLALCCWANNSQYGLSASIWTENITKAHKLAAQIDVGTVWINTWLQRDLRVPFGGMKASGQGREGGEHSIDFYTEQKTVSISL